MHGTWTAHWPEGRCCSSGLRLPPPQAEGTALAQRHCPTAQISSHGQVILLFKCMPERVDVLIAGHKDSVDV